MMKVGGTWKRLVWVVVIGVVVGVALATPTTEEEQHESLEETQELESEHDRDGKLFVLLAQIAASECTTNDPIRTQGTCMPSKQCSNQGGKSQGTCAKGLGTCCLATRTCNAASSYNNTYFINPDSTDVELGACTLTINRVNSNICQMRFDFISLDLSQPDINGACNHDFFTVTGGVSKVPMICGRNNGQHIYYDVDPNGGTVKLTIDRFDISSLSRSWDIKVTQIACDSRFRAPEGCLQYYTATTGTVNSFNFLNTNTNTDVNGTRQLANEDYGVCIKRADNYCGIIWEASKVGGNFGFTVSGPADAIQLSLIGTINTSTRDGNCTTDYVVIPGGLYTLDDATNTVQAADRYCGLGFPPSVTTTAQPFVLYVKSNGNELMEAINRGFSLNYRQIKTCM